MQNSASQDFEWFHPGEVVIVARVAREATSERELHRAMRGLLGRHASDYLAGDEDSLRSYVFSAPDEDQSLVFLFQTLTSRDSIPDVKTAVEALHGQVPNLRTNTVDVLGVMPHWHVRAHELTSGGSPGSRPAPVDPGTVRRGARRWRYQPGPESLRAAEGGQSVPVAVLDTRIDLAGARRRAEQLHNDQLLETIDWLQRDKFLAGTGYDDEWPQVEQHHGQRRAEYDMSDHGLFVAGLIHDLAPNAPLTFAPVLDEHGAGDLSLLLAAISALLERKQPSEPLILNMSLGFRPHPAHLTAAWHGLELDDPTYTRAPIMFDGRRDKRWVASHGTDETRRANLLQAGLSELGRYLSLNNCLIVAAAGNDSREGEVRLPPRLPARFDTVLGVAATARNHHQPASYSNVGDEGRRGDHVATFGGERGDRSQPVDGVVGVFSGELPDGPSNATGWAYWSGTSFSTALVSGMAANVWGRRPDAHATEILAEVHDVAFHAGGMVPELRAPSIPISGDWE